MLILSLAGGTSLNQGCRGGDSRCPCTLVGLALAGYSLVTTMCLNSSFIFKVRQNTGKTAVGAQKTPNQVRLSSSSNLNLLTSTILPYNPTVTPRSPILPGPTCLKNQHKSIVMSFFNLSLKKGGKKTPSKGTKISPVACGRVIFIHSSII